MSLLGQQCEALLGNAPTIGGLNNVAAFLHEELAHVNWAGFYFAKNGRLELAMFVGRPACAILPFDKGVCAKAYRENQTVIVGDVHAFAGHIACDSASASEIVLPLRFHGRVIGVLDIDSDVKNRFDEATAPELTEVRDALEKSVDWQSLASLLFDEKGC